MRENHWFTATPSNCSCSMSSYMFFSRTSFSFCFSKFGSFCHTYTIFTHIFNQFYRFHSVNINSKLLPYLYWLINIIKGNCIPSLPCLWAHLDSKISRYWLTDESFLTFGYDLITRKEEILSNTDTFDIFCGVYNSSQCDYCSDPICGYASGINLKNARLITNTNTKLSMIMLDSGTSLACTQFKEGFENLTLIKGDEKPFNKIELSSLPSHHIKRIQVLQDSKSIVRVKIGMSSLHCSQGICHYINTTISLICK